MIPRGWPSVRSSGGLTGGLRGRVDRSGDLHFGSSPGDPTGVGDCRTCGGRPLQQRGAKVWACPDCTARQTARDDWHRGRQERGEVRSVGDVARALVVEVNHNRVRHRARDN